MTERWWDVLDEDEFDPERHLAVFHWPARRYAVRRWNPLGTLNNEDYASIALLALVELAKIEKLGQRGPRAFWAALKQRIDWDISKARERGEGPDVVRHYHAVATPEGAEDDPARVYTALRAHSDHSLLARSMTDVIAIMPRAVKIPLALYFFERLTIDQVAGVTGANRKTLRGWIAASTRYLLHHARGEVIERSLTEKPPKLPDLTEISAQKLEDGVTAFVAQNYGVDLPAWLGWVQRCYEADVSYLLDMLDHGHGNITHHKQTRIDYDADVDRLDALIPPPVSAADLAERLGWSKPRGLKALAAWRLRNGVATPRNRHEVQKARAEAARSHRPRVHLVRKLDDRDEWGWRTARTSAEGFATAADAANDARDYVLSSGRYAA
jgi:hypothetical protein